MLFKVNFRDHPTDSSYEVYNFDSSEQAQHFTLLLTAEGIEYEQAEEQNVYYVATPKRNSKAVRRLNNLSIGAFRTPFIADKGVRWLIVLLPIILVALALVGWWVNG